MDKDYDISSLVSQMDFNSGRLQDIGNGVLLTNQEITVLDRYSIDYKKCTNLKEVLFEVESIIEELGDACEDLDYISSTIAERDYYQNTNK